jgi:hypothetical protein
MGYLCIGLAHIVCPIYVQTTICGREGGGWVMVGQGQGKGNADTGPGKIQQGENEGRVGCHCRCRRGFDSATRRREELCIISLMRPRPRQGISHTYVCVWTSSDTVEVKSDSSIILLYHVPGREVNGGGTGAGKGTDS